MVKVKFHGPNVESSEYVDAAAIEKIKGDISLFKITINTMSVIVDAGDFEFPEVSIEESGHQVGGRV